MLFEWRFLIGMAALSIALLLGATVSADSGGARADAPPATVMGTESYQIQSKHVDQLFSIDVYVPPRAEGPLPVVYVLDGNPTFATAAQAVGPMTYSGDLPPMIVVGVGYVITDPYEVITLRVRDLTPSYSVGVAERMAAGGMPLPKHIRPGGADAFLRFLDEELKPFIAARYDVKADDRTLVGDSLGGLFALHVAFNSTGSFDRYVAGSPAISWAGDALFKAEAALAGRVKDVPIHLFLSAGSLETKHEMIPNVEKMTAALQQRRYPGLKLTTHIFPDETHQSVIPATLSRGFRAVFGTLPK